MAKHSTIVGGSTAGRILNCPASRSATLALPPAVADVPSEYAEQGTAMHEVMARLMHIRTEHLTPDPGRLLGMRFHDRTLTQEYVDDMIQPALDALDTLEREYARPGAGPFRVVGIEQKVRFPGLPGAFGTIDLILANASTVLHADWKFGAGVGVAATYAHEAGGEILNPQLMFYTAAALHSRKSIYTNKKDIVVAIIQPRGVQPLTHALVSRPEIKTFVEDVHNAVLASIDRDPPRVRGEHCRFAPCKITCPLWTGPLLDLSAIGPPPDVRDAPGGVSPYGEYLARAKALVDSAAMFKKEVDEQLHAFLANGGTVPGWRLKARVKLRQWVDPSVVAAKLSQLGFAENEIWAPRLVTFQQADATARRKGVKVPDELRVAPPSTETTIATVEDPAPVVEPQATIEMFRASLAQLTAPAD